jgi:hypothetical protein
MKKNGKNINDFLLEAYQKTGLSRRRFLRRISLQITGAGALLAALAGKAKSCSPCTGCNTGCNTGCDVGCETMGDSQPCMESNSCMSGNVCKFNACIGAHTCHQENFCHTNMCEIDNICTINTCDGDTCKNDTCGTNSCDVNTCNGNICEEDDWCTYWNKCWSADVDCGYGDVSCIVVNFCVVNEG